MDVSNARLSVFMSEGKIPSDHFIGSPECHPMQFMAEILREQGWDRRDVGVEMEKYCFTACCYEVLRRELPGAAFPDAGLLVNWVRLVKSHQELVHMREAGEGVGMLRQDQVGVRIRRVDGLGRCLYPVES